jgi:hypothetical protein
MSTRLRWALWLCALAITGYLSFGAGPAPEEAVVEAADSRAANNRPTRAASDIRILALQPRALSAETKALFAATSWAPPPPKALPPTPPPPPPPPTAPPLPFRFVGKQWTGELWEVFVSRGDQTLVLREKQTIEAAYRVDSIKPPNMVMTYLPLNEPQTMNIGSTE